LSGPVSVLDATSPTAVLRRAAVPAAALNNAKTTAAIPRSARVFFMLRRDTGSTTLRARLEEQRKRHDVVLARFDAHAVDAVTAKHSGGFLVAALRISAEALARR